MEDAASPDRVKLIDSAPIRLGGLTIEPAQRTVRDEQGRSATLEPRVMQVLVALARSPNAIHSRDELVSACWNAVAVSDDAVNRVISLLRRQLGEFPNSGVSIETITKVGYRLVVDEAASRAGDTERADSSGRSRRWALGAGLAAILLAALALSIGTGWIGGDGPNGAGTLAVEVGGAQSSAHDARSARLARQLPNDLRKLTPAGISVSGETRPFPASLISKEPRVQVQVAANDAASGIDVVLRWPDSEEPIWSGGISQTSGDADTDRARIAAQLANALLCLQRALRGKLRRSSAELYLRACIDRQDERDIERVTKLRQLAKANPKSAFAWAELSRAEARLASLIVGMKLRSSDARATGQLARGHLKRAEALDPKSTETVLAQWAVSALDEPRAWKRRLALLDQAIARDPGRAELYSHRSVELFAVGRLRNALEEARRSVELEPSSPDYRARLIALLSYSNLHEAARREIAEARRIWPDSVTIRNAEFFFDLRYGDPARADATAKAAGFSSVHMPVWEAYLKARQYPSSANIERAVALARNVQRRDPSWTPQHLQLLGHFGKVDTAYADLTRDSATFANGTVDPTIFFRVHTRPLVYDRRFMEVAQKIGLVDYWRETGDWPDFCFAPDLPYDCRSVAAAQGA